MAKKKQNKKVSTPEKEYNKLVKKGEVELKKVQKDNANSTKEIETSDNPKSTTKERSTPKERKSSKEKKKMSANKSVKDMTREELIRSATSVAQHSNKTLREYEKADKGHLYAHGKLLEIADRYDIKTRGNRVSRSFKKLSDNQLRDFITEAKQTYTGKSVKSVSTEFDRRRKITTDMLKTRFDVDVSKLNKLNDSQFSELYSRLVAGRASEAKAYNSNEVVLNFLKDFSLLDEDQEDEIALAVQKQRESNERLNRNKAVNRNRGRKR